MERVYAAIDLKSFFASVECVKRGLDPLNVNLVVADPTRTEKTICLAISPALKTYGLPGRARLFEVLSKVQLINAERASRVPYRRLSGSSCFADELQNNPDLALNFVIAPPHMKDYIKTSAKIYKIYLDYVAPEDIFAYSIDEVFLDLTSYLKLYQMSPEQLVTKLVSAVYQRTGITATAGIGSNLYLAKVALDILAKHAAPNAAGVRIAELNESSYRQKLWTHQPLTDFWRIGPGYNRQLRKHCIYTMGDIARCSLDNPSLLYKLFGVNAELLIDHAWGFENATIASIKSYQPSSTSLSSGQVLQSPYDFTKARNIVREMSDSLTLNMSAKGYVTNQLVLHVSYDPSSLEQYPQYSGPLSQDRYGRKKPKSAHGTLRLPHATDSVAQTQAGFLKLYDQLVRPNLLVRKITLCVGELSPSNLSTSEPTIQQAQLFPTSSSQGPSAKTSLTDAKLQTAILDIQKRYGKNAILKGFSFEEGATAIARNHQIGGHKE